MESHTVFLVCAATVGTEGNILPWICGSDIFPLWRLDFHLKIKRPRLLGLISNIAKISKLNPLFLKGGKCSHCFSGDGPAPMTGKQYQKCLGADG